MIVELARLDIVPGREAAFERAMRTARPLIEATPGFGAMEMRRCVEAPHRYLPR